MPHLPNLRGRLEDRLGRGRRPLRGAFRGTRERAEPGTTALVVGGGLAGIAAATILAERGVSVTLLDARTTLGGRLRGGTGTVAASPLAAFHRHYYNLRSLITRIDPELSSLRSLEDFVVLGPEGAIESFANLPTAAPLNLLALLRRTPFLSLSELRNLSSERARQLVLYDPSRHAASLDTLSAHDFLTELGLPSPAREMLFRVFSHAVFHDEREFSAAEMLANLHFHFLGNPEGMLFDVLDEPPDDGLFAPFDRTLRALGVRMCLGHKVVGVQRERGDRVRVRTDDGSAFDAGGIVLALDSPGVRELVHASPDLRVDAPFARSCDELRPSGPYVLWRLHFDAPASPTRRPFVAVAALGALDAITLHSRLEGESRRAALRSGGEVVQLQAYALPEHLDDEAIRADLLGTLRTLYPEFLGAHVLESSYLRRADGPSFAPGSLASRPKVATPYGNVALAGDYVRLPFLSSLLERSVASGLLAANLLLDRWDVQGEPVYTAPPRGFVSSLVTR